MNFCVFLYLYFGLIHFGGVSFEFAVTCTLSPSCSFGLNLNLYENKIYTTMYLNVSINYLSNMNCKFVMRFDYHDNLLKENEKFET